MKHVPRVLQEDYIDQLAAVSLCVLSYQRLVPTRWEMWPVNSCQVDLAPPGGVSTLKAIVSERRAHRNFPRYIAEDMLAVRKSNVDS